MPEDGGEVWHEGELEIYKIRLFHGIIAMFNLHLGGIKKCIQNFWKDYKEMEQ